MYQQFENQQNIQIISSNQNNIDSIKQYFPIFPYQSIPPYWPYPYFQSQQHQIYKLQCDTCKVCRDTIYATKGTQTEKQNQLNETQIKPIKEIQQIQRKKNVSVNSQVSGVQLQVKEEFNESDQQQVHLKSFETSKKQIKSSSQNDYNQSLQSSIEKNPTLNRYQPSQKQKIFEKMLKQFLMNIHEYDKLVSEHMKSNSLFSQLVRYFNEKLQNFKKSKEEMIKLVIRRTQRQYKAEYNCKKDERFKKFGGYKSMNTIYLQNLFSDKQFARCYENTINDFFVDFQKDSSDKLDSFLSKVSSCESYEDFLIAMKTLDEKNKMPWPVFWIQKLKRVCIQLQQTYLSAKSQTDERKQVDCQKRMMKKQKRSQLSSQNKIN